MKRLGGDRRGIIGVILAAIVILIVIIIVAALLLIPFRSATVDETQEAAIGQGVEALQLNIDVDMAEVTVRFVDDADVAVSMSVSGNQRSGLLGPQEPVNITWEERTEGDTLIVNAGITLGGSFMPFFGSDINCTVLVSKQLRTALSVSAGVGGMDVEATDGAFLTSMDLTVTTGGLRATMADNVTLDGPMAMEATTGGIDLIWSNVAVGDNASVVLNTNTGGVRATVTQTEGLGGNLTLRATANTGGVDLRMNLAGNTSAHVMTSTSVGGVSVEERVGFNGTDQDLRSENYASDSNFEVTLNTNTGGVNMRLRYEA
jgi:hypothetical protein